MSFAREAYLYARHNGQGDLSAADFVEWCSENHEPSWTLADAYAAWCRVVDDIAMWDRQLTKEDS